MDYDAILAQVMTLLQQEQRLSYRVLKRRLQLDDDLLEDLNEDLIYAKKLAVDEDGRVLVWTAGAGQEPQPAPEGILLSQPVPPSAVPSSPNAERRQRAAARQLLAEVYGWFTEGFDTADLQEAKALLEALT